MNIQKNVSLKSYSTMKLGGQAAYECDINNQNDLIDALHWADEQKLPVIMVGIGSNIVWKDSGFQGLLLVNKIAGFQILDQDTDNLYLMVGAGEIWDSVVKRSVDLGFSGIEQLSLIPGNTGATPVQNVGAYGREISEVLVSVEAYDKQVGKIINLQPIDCGFGYRTSRFKTTDKGRFFITSITLHLTRTMLDTPTYSEVDTYLQNHNISSPGPKDIREAVIAIRTAKLPDPAVVANTGSFFTNPIVSKIDLNGLIESFPGIKYWEMDDDQAKLSAAWLIEQAGFKDYKDNETGISTWPTQPLVLINEHAKSTDDLLRCAQKITDAVKNKFGVKLAQEPELLPIA